MGGEERAQVLGSDLSRLSCSPACSVAKHTALLDSEEAAAVCKVLEHTLPHLMPRVVL